MNFFEFLFTEFAACSKPPSKEAAMRLYIFGKTLHTYFLLRPNSIPALPDERLTNKTEKVVAVVAHICPFVTGQRQTLTVGRSVHFSLQ